MRQYCVQCVAEVLGDRRVTPGGETLCGSCYSALWGPKASEELRSLVRLHTGGRRPNGQVIPQRTNGQVIPQRA